MVASTTVQFLCGLVIARHAVDLVAKTARIRTNTAAWRAALERKLLCPNVVLVAQTVCASAQLLAHFWPTAGHTLSSAIAIAALALRRDVGTDALALAALASKSNRRTNIANLAFQCAMRCIAAPLYAFHAVMSAAVDVATGARIDAATALGQLLACLMLMVVLSPVAWARLRVLLTLPHRDKG